jgi:hypothetical protein
MSDILNRLRDARQWLNNGDCCGQKDSDDTCAAPACIFGESLKELYSAADEIERLRKALATYACRCGDGDCYKDEFVASCGRSAQVALGGDKK